MSRGSRRLDFMLREKNSKRVKKKYQLLARKLLIKCLAIRIGRKLS